MKFIIIIIVCNILFAQTNVEQYPVDLDIISEIREEGLENSKLPDTFSYMTDVLGARLTNSNDMYRAQEWIIKHLEDIGLENIQLEPFMDYGVSWDNTYFSLHLLEPDYQPMLGYPIAHTPGTMGKKRLDTVIAVIRTKSDLKKYKGKLRGKAVLSTPPPTINLDVFRDGVKPWTDEQLKEKESPRKPAKPRSSQSNSSEKRISSVERNAFFKKEGVSVILESRSGWLAAVRGFARPGAKQDVYEKKDTVNHLPVVAVTPEHYNRMYRILERDIPVKIEVDIKTTIGNQRREARNVIAEIPGSDLKDEVVMLGAHFDTWHASPNASDNTSGVAVMIEALRILKEIGVQPRRTIRIALWSGEEQGLWGSKKYVEKYFGTEKKPKPDYEKFSVYFNQDYGPGLYRGIYLQGNENAHDVFSSWTKPFNDLGMTTVSPQSVGSTDHIPFDRVGLPAFQFLQDRVGGTGGHTNLDFYDTIRIEDLKKNAVIVAAFIYHAAMMDERIPRKEKGD